MDGSLIEEVPPEHARKTYRATSTKRKEATKKCYTAKKPPTLPSCTHKNGSQYECSEIKMEDAKAMYDSFYAVKRKAHQDAFILKYVKVCKVQRRRKPKGTKARSRDMSLQYSAVLTNGSTVRVCADAFRSILQVGSTKVAGVMKHFRMSGNLRTEKRGGDRIRYRFAAKREAVCTYIKQYRAVESHYSRENSVRVYLPSHLNINKLWRDYNAQAVPELKVKRTFFRSVFESKFNIGFGTPQSDACSTCLSLKERVKVEVDQTELQKLQVQLRIHKLRAKAFYESLRLRKPDLLTFCFDCQKNQVLPKVPDQSAYYSRQMYIYNFTVVELRQDKEYPIIFTWNECDRPKSSNEICSAVHYALQHANLDGITTVRLCADGCAGQNKNSAMIFMASFWLIVEAPAHVEAVKLVFPVVGHSYIPPDRVFGRIEKTLKKHDTIIQPSTYHEIYAEHGTVLRMGVDYQCQDWKEQSKDLLKPTRDFPFRISEAKRMLITRNGNSVLVRGEPHYKYDVNNGASILKRGKAFSASRFTDLSIGVPISVAKATDVDNLLKKHFGDDWHSRDNLSFYANAIGNTVATRDDDDLFECLCSGETPSLHV